MNYFERLQESRRLKKRIIAMHRTGQKQVKIAERIGRTPQYVHKVIKDWTGTGVAAPERTLKGGQNRPLKQAKTEQSEQKGSKIDPDR